MENKTQGILSNIKGWTALWRAKHEMLLSMFFCQKFECDAEPPFFPMRSPRSFLFYKKCDFCFLLISWLAEEMKWRCYRWYCWHRRLTAADSLILFVRYVLHGKGCFGLKGNKIWGGWSNEVAVFVGWRYLLFVIYSLCSFLSVVFSISFYFTVFIVDDVPIQANLKLLICAADQECPPPTQKNRRKSRSLVLGWRIGSCWLLFSEGYVV